VRKTPSVASAIERSGIREIMDLARERSDAIRLEVGQPDFETPPHIVAAADRAARSGFTRFTASKGPAEPRAVGELRGKA
jgi:aspartate aminotransferase